MTRQCDDDVRPATNKTGRVVLKLRPLGNATHHQLPEDACRLGKGRDDARDAMDREEVDTDSRDRRGHHTYYARGNDPLERADMCPTLAQIAHAARSSYSGSDTMSVALRSMIKQQQGRIPRPPWPLSQPLEPQQPQLQPSAAEHAVACLQGAMSEAPLVRDSERMGDLIMMRDELLRNASAEERERLPRSGKDFLGEFRYMLRTSVSPVKDTLRPPVLRPPLCLLPSRASGGLEERGKLMPTLMPAPLCFRQSVAQTDTNIQGRSPLSPAGTPLLRLY